MKKFAFVLLGLLAAACTLTSAAWTLNSHGDLIYLLITAAFAYGTYRAFREAGRLAPAPTEPERRPWER